MLMTSVDKILQVLNDVALLPSIVCLFLFGTYFSRESRRRGLRALDWLHLPPSMNLGLAMFIFDIGICLRISAAWLWFFAGGIIPVQLLYILANISILIGFFCKIRALTEPDYGPRPWLVVMILTSLVGVALLFVP